MRGLRPRRSARLIENNQAQIAKNCRISSGGVEAWREKKLDQAIALLGEIKTIYQFPDGKWLQWNEEVDVVEAPVAGDTTDRLYFSGTDKPRVTNSTLIDVSSPNTGVITGATKDNPCVITDVAHDLSTGMSIDIDNVVGMTELNGNRYKVTVLTADTFSLNVDSTGFTTYVSDGDWTRVELIYPEDSYVVGVPAPAAAPTATLVAGTPVTSVNTAYVYTYVNDWGEEGPPSPVSNIISVDFSTDTVDLTTMSAAPDSYLDYVPITKWRIYRILSGTAGADYLFVAEVTINVSSPQYNDSIASTSLGESLTTTDFDLPLSGLIGLKAMANGIVAGFIGNTVYFSESFLPYTFPDKYTLVTDYDIVGLGSFGNSLVITTEGPPYLATGTSPDSMSMDKLPFPQPCISKRGIVDVQGGVIYPTTNGLFFVGVGGSKLVTKDYYTRREWQDLSPSTMISVWYDNRYFAFLPTQGNILEYHPQEDELTTIDTNGTVTAFYLDKQSDRMYFCMNESNINNIYEFAADSTRMTFLWRSKKFEMPFDLTLTAARIIGDFDVALTQEELDALNAARTAALAANVATISGGLCAGSVNASAVNVLEVNGDILQTIPPLPVDTTYPYTLYVDGVVIASGSITSNDPVRLPAGYRGRTIEIEMGGKFQLHRVLFGTSIMDVMR